MTPEVNPDSFVTYITKTLGFLQACKQSRAPHAISKVLNGPTVLRDNTMSLFLYPRSME
jgi:hypothetical protein